jgi:hypothetical protein
MCEVVNLKTCTDWGQPGDVKIDRTTKWGNPFPMRNEQYRDHVIKQYRKWLAIQEFNGTLNIDELLDAKRLGCWCAPRACHGDVLLERVNERRRKLARDEPQRHPTTD